LDDGLLLVVQLGGEFRHLFKDRLVLNQLELVVFDLFQDIQNILLVFKRCQLIEVVVSFRNEKTINLVLQIFFKGGRGDSGDLRCFWLLTF
jgi:hypothetical protein